MRGRLLSTTRADCFRDFLFDHQTPLSKPFRPIRFWPPHLYAVTISRDASIFSNLNWSRYQSAKCVTCRDSWMRFVRLRAIFIYGAESGPEPTSSSKFAPPERYMTVLSNR